MNELTKKILLGIAGTGAALGLGYWLFGRKQGEDLGGYGEVEDIEPLAVRGTEYPTTSLPGETSAPKARGRRKAKASCSPVELAQEVTSNTQILACRGDSIGPQMRASRDIYEFVKGQSQILQEEMVVLAMSSRNEVIASAVVHRGAGNEVRVNPADVMRVPVVFGATRMALVHNHPSGDPTPSPSDVALTKRMKTVGDEMGIALLDHVIVGRNDFASLRDLGAME
jgi:DNA repair protein RadC